jgi:glucose-1-phosphate thymidylyltransferase
MYMSGIILAGGTGSRLGDLTMVTNKHLLPVYNNPMIYYPLRTLINAGIEEIMIVSGRAHAGHFLELLGSGEEFGVNLSYTVQESPSGIAGALRLCKRFAHGDNIAVILGDNIYEDKFDFSDFRQEPEFI